MERLINHGLIYDAMLRNAGVVCQKYQTTLASPSMIGRNGSKRDTTDDLAIMAELEGAEWGSSCAIFCTSAGQRVMSG